VKKLTVERQRRGWSKAELGRRARIHPSRVGQAENGRALLYDVEMKRLVRALDWQGDPAALLEEVSHDQAV